MNTTPTFKCLMCFFEQDSIEVLVDHLHNVHNIFPFECLNCKDTFDELNLASLHCTENQSKHLLSKCLPLSMKVNFNTIYGMFLNYIQINLNLNI